MKNITLKLGIIICSCIFSVSTHAQTNVIALKSQAGEMADILERDDNFGAIDPRYEYSAIDSVKYDVKTKSIVNYRNYGNDTIFYTNEKREVIMDHLKAIRLNPWYSPNTRFIGFPLEIEKLAPKNPTLLENSMSVWGAILTLLFAGGFLARKKVLS